ncbi:transposable element Tcb1 transposase [Trichonephila clavipes]|uniref:Transposable element Tcb1 transposase n=1 Tax=Trichonephila clavipes TaxID=2585209 RepID=A0A8X6SDN1_TRICX|nr:transposable element Tcb1 transposase [Trichonephila clavipes]
MGAEFLFMDDNARPYRANIVDECLQSEDITHMDWPAYSPDFNPIEHVWDMLGRRIAARQPPPTCLPELRGGHCLMSGVIFPKIRLIIWYSACLGVSWLEIYANLQSPKTPKSISDKVPYRSVTFPPRRKRDLFESLKWPEINYVAIF